VDAFVSGVPAVSDQPPPPQMLTSAELRSSDNETTAPDDSEVPTLTT
jgi:hypothetical protein